jgi:hypothetical protein
LADEEDPLAIRLRESFEANLPDLSSRRHKKHKKVRYQFDQDDGQGDDSHAGLVNKEEIHIPDSGPRLISGIEHTIAAMMNGGERQMHGLTGKGLMYGLNIILIQ